MEAYKVVMGIGGILMIIGLLAMTSVTIHPTWTEDLVELAIKLAIPATGWLVIKKGERMRDKREVQS